MAESKSSINRLRVHENKLRALELRKSAMTFERIGQELDVSTGQAHSYVKSALKETLRESADELRTLELERIDVMLAGVWEKARRGDLQAIDRVLSLMGRRASLLGLDAPAKLEQGSIGGGPITLAFVERSDGPQ